MCIRDRNNLEALAFKNCNQLSDLNYISGFDKLSVLQINECGITSTLGLKDLPVLKSINFNNNNNLKDITEIGQISSLKNVTLSGCPNIKSLDSLTKLSNLLFLRVDKHNLETLEGISSLIKPLMEGLRKE